MNKRNVNFVYSQCYVYTPTCFFSVKIECAENEQFTPNMNSGNFYVTLQSDLCPVGSWKRLKCRFKDAEWQAYNIGKRRIKIVLTIKLLRIMEMNYVAPELEVMEVMGEQGFFVSNEESENNGGDF